MDAPLQGKRVLEFYSGVGGSEASLESFFFSPHAYFKIGFHAALKAVDPTGLMVLFFFDVFVSPYVENSASFGGI